MITDTAQPSDDHRVALIKSLATNNRFYALASNQSGISNAEVVEEIPHDLLLGIAYPCLEDGLNDFAVIRTSYETLALFADDEDMCKELTEIITDARRSLTRRLMELLERIIARKAYFLGTDLELFKSSALDIMSRGFPRQNLDSMMKVNVFSSVAETEMQMGGAATDISVFYRYEFCNSDVLARLSRLSGRDFLISLFADVLDSVLDDDNYQSKYTFDKNVFQQFIALMFLTYAATDEVFYGTSPDDYGVSKDRNMDETPLYQAVRHELHRIANPSATQAGDFKSKGTPLESATAADTEDLFGLNPVAALSESNLSHLPLDEDAILSPLASICAIAQQLHKHYRGDTAELSRLILADASRLVQELKRMGVLSPLAYDPGISNPRAELPEAGGE